MKLTKILMGGAAVLSPAVVLPLVNATKVANNTESNTTATSNEIITVASDGWVWIDANHKSRYHISFDQANHTCVLDRMSIGSQEADKLVVKPQAVYKSVAYPYDEFKLTKIDTAKRHNDSGYINCLDLSEATNLEEICAHAFDTGDAGGCKYRIQWVIFSGAINLKKIGEEAFWNQWFEKNTEDLDLDFSNTSLERIEQKAFRACCRKDAQYKYSRSIIFPATLKYIGDYAFESNDGKNNFCPRKIVFLGDEPPEVTNGGALPSVADDVAGQTCVIVPSGKKQIYWNKWTKAHSGSHYEIGQAIKESNLIESSIKFNANDGELGVGTINLYKQAGLIGQDDKKWCPVSTATGKLVTDNRLWLSNDANGKIHLDKESDGQYRLKWDADLPAGVYPLIICASTGSGALMTVTGTKCTLTITEVTLTGGSSVIRASYAEGFDTKIWRASLSNGLEVADIEGVVKTPSSLTGLSADKVEPNGLRLSWGANMGDVGTYNIKIVATITDNLGNKYTYYAPVTLIVEETYYKLSIETDDTAKTEVSSPIQLVKTASATKDVFLRMYEGDSTSRTYLSEPALSIGNKAGITFTEEAATKGLYKIHIDSSELALGTYQLYARSFTNITVGTETIKYPVYSNVITIQILDSTTAVSCTGGQAELTSYYNKAGQDDQQWVVSELDGYTTNVGNIDVKRTSWTTIDQERLNHIKAIKDSTAKNKFSLQWDSTFTAMTSWWEIVDFDLDFDVTYIPTQANADTITKHVVLPISMSIRNAGEIKSAAGQNIVGYPETSWQVEEPWEMYSNGAATPVTSSVYYWIDDTELPEAWQGKITMETHEGEINKAYLTYRNLTKGSNSFNVYAYDSENVVLTQQQVTLVIDNVATIYGAPSSLSINRGNGKYATKLTVKVNGEDYEGDVTFQVDNIDNEMFWIDKDGYINWTDKLEEGIYDPMIYVSIELDGETVSSVPVSIKLTVNPAAGGGTNVGAIVGGSVGGAVGAGGAATGGYFGIKKLKAGKGKKK